MKLRIQNYSDPNFDVNKLADLLGVCRNHLTNKMQFEFNCTPHCYIEKYRIRKAVELLLSNICTIKICKSVGFSNKKTFYNAFKRITGLTPREYKENELS